MAEISVKKVQAGTFRIEDFGVSSGSRVYRIWYDVPGIDMEDHVHMIPVEALANYRIDSSEEDPMVAMQYYLQEAMTRMQASLTMSYDDLMTHPESPLVVQNSALLALREQQHTAIPLIGASVPGDTPDQVVSGTEEVVVTPTPQVMQMKAVKLAPHIETPTQQLSDAQLQYHSVVSASVALHPIDTSTKAWASLTQMVSDDTAVLAATQREWFEHRYGRQIRVVSSPRFTEAAK